MSAHVRLCLCACVLHEQYLISCSGPDILERPAHMTARQRNLEFLRVNSLFYQRCEGAQKPSPKVGQDTADHSHDLFVPVGRHI